jgi:hypothetical protein
MRVLVVLLLQESFKGWRHLCRLLLPAGCSRAAPRRQGVPPAAHASHTLSFPIIGQSRQDKKRHQVQPGTKQSVGPVLAQVRRQVALLAASARALLGALQAWGLHRNDVAAERCAVELGRLYEAIAERQVRLISFWCVTLA